jgi:hypothetical protein
VKLITFLLAVSIQTGLGHQAMRGLDPGYPNPVGCLDHYGYVRPEDLEELDAPLTAALRDLRAGRSEQALDAARRALQSKPSVSGYKVMIDASRKLGKLPNLVAELKERWQKKKSAHADLAWLSAATILGEDKKAF